MYHASKATDCAAISYALHCLGLGPWWAFLGALVAYLVVPHVVYLVQRKYPPNPTDWLADLVCCSAIVPFIGWQQYGYRSGLLLLVGFASCYYATYPFADEQTP